MVVAQNVIQATVAQLVEHTPEERGVGGSIPFGGIMEILSKETLDLLKIPRVRDAFRKMITSDEYPPKPISIELDDGRIVTFRIAET
jgi:hypothetical protein